MLPVPVLPALVLQNQYCNRQAAVLRRIVQFSDGLVIKHDMPLSSSVLNRMYQNDVDNIGYEFQFVDEAVGNIFINFDCHHGVCTAPRP